MKKNIKKKKNKEEKKDDYKRHIQKLCIHYRHHLTSIDDFLKSIPIQGRGIVIEVTFRPCF